MADPNETMPNPNVAKTLLQKLKEPALFCAWVIGLMIVGSLVWILTRPVLSANLMKNINYSLAAQGENQFLSHVIVHPRQASLPMAKPVPRGIWFAYADSSNVFFAFTILHDGIMIPCGAQITGDGKVANIFLLSEHAQQVYDRLPQGIVMLYISRIENALDGWGQK